MIRFKKYSSIENSFDAEFMDKVRAEMPSDLKYVVQEKVHGANTSFLCDGNDVCLPREHPFWQTMRNSMTTSRYSRNIGTAC